MFIEFIKICLIYYHSTPNNFCRQLECEDTFETSKYVSKNILSLNIKIFNIH